MSSRCKDERRFDLYFALRALIEIVRRFDRREDAPSRIGWPSTRSA